MSRILSLIKAAYESISPVFSLTRITRFAAELRVVKRVRTIGFFGGSGLIILGADIGEKLRDTSLTMIVALSAVTSVLLYAYASRQLQRNVAEETESSGTLPTYFFLISAGVLVGSVLLWLIQVTANTPKDESTILAALSKTVATEFEEVDEGISDIKEQLSEIHQSRKSEEYGAQLSFEVDEVSGDPMVVRGAMDLGELRELDPIECEFVGSLAETHHFKLQAMGCERFEATYKSLSSNPLEYTKEMSSLTSVFGVSAPLLRVELDSGDELRLPAYNLIGVLVFPHGNMPGTDIRQQVKQSITYTLDVRAEHGSVVATALLGGKKIQAETDCEWSTFHRSVALELQPTNTHCEMVLLSRSNIFDKNDREITVVFNDRETNRFVGMATMELTDAVIDQMPSAFENSIAQREPIYRVAAISSPRVTLQSVEVEIQMAITDASVPRLTLEQFMLIADKNNIERLLSGNAMRLGSSRATVISHGSTVRSVAQPAETPAKIATCSLIALNGERTLAIEVWALNRDGRYARVAESNTAAPQGLSDRAASRVCGSGGYWPKAVLNSLRASGGVPHDLTTAAKLNIVTEACSTASDSSKPLATCIREVEKSVRRIDLEVDAKPCWAMNKRFITTLYHLRNYAMLPDDLDLPSCELLAGAGAILSDENGGAHTQQYRKMATTSQRCVDTRTAEKERFLACMQFVEGGAPLIALEGACKRRNAQSLTKANLERWVATARTRFSQPLGQYGDYLPAGISRLPADAAQAFAFVENSAELFNCATLGL